jgi:fructose-1,6-bisphosphatase/inositol monophosphatase family enzyme
MLTKKKMKKSQFGVLGSSASTSYVQNQNLIIMIDPIDATNFLKDIMLLQ